MKFKHLLTTFFLGLTFCVNAQFYELTISSAPYADLVGSTSLNGEVPWDDPEFVIPLGFDFDFFDITYTELAIREWGLGGSLGTTDFTNITTPFLTPYGADVIDRGYDFSGGEPTDGSLSNISYLVEGAEGSKILKVEWKNVGFYTELEEDNISTDFTNFQMWLYEGSNDIEVRFGMNSITDPEASFDEQTGSWIGLFENLNLDTEELTGEAFTLSGTPESAELTTINGNLENAVTFLDGIIPNSTVYKFSESIGSSTSNNPAENLGISIFPNPVANHVELRLDDPTHQITAVTIRNLTGQILRKVEYQHQSIDVSDVSAGVYLLEINTTAGVVHKRIVKK